MRVLLSLLLLLCLISCSHTPNKNKDFIDHCPRTDDMPKSYKMDYYRAATPPCVPNGRTINIPQLISLMESKNPILVDVLPLIRSVDEGFGSTWLQKEEHITLPNTTWLPNVGHGQIEPEIEKFLIKNLNQLTGKDKNRHLVFFCIVDCWMSWNTVQRVREYGYTQVYWYKDGTDGWRNAGYEMFPIKPEPLTELDKELNDN